MNMVKYHMEASFAQLVEEKSEAELTYGVTDCDHVVTDVEEILAEML